MNGLPVPLIYRCTYIDMQAWNGLPQQARVLIFTIKMIKLSCVVSLTEIYPLLIDEKRLHFVEMLLEILLHALDTAIQLEGRPHADHPSKP